MQTDEHDHMDKEDLAVVLQHRIQKRGGTITPLLEKHGNEDELGDFHIPEDDIPAFIQDMRVVLGDNVAEPPEW